MNEVDIMHEYMKELSDVYFKDKKEEPYDIELFNAAFKRGYLASSWHTKSVIGITSDDLLNNVKKLPSDQEEAIDAYRTIMKKSFK